MAEPVIDPMTVFHAAPILGDGMTQNLGGDGSNMTSRGKYNMITGATATDPSLSLEIYHKFNQKITD